MAKSPVALIIMDGYGLSDVVEGNAVKAANTPHLDKYFKEYPNTRLEASGLAVGLPKGTDGQQRGRSHKYRRGQSRIPDAC